MASVESIFLGLAKEQFGLIIGIGVGEALAAALEPQVVAIRQAEYDGDPNVAINAATAAAIAAEVIDKYDTMAADARQHGINGDRFKDLYGVTLTAPGTGELLAMLRREDEVPIDFEHGLRKAKLETDWDKALRNLRDVRIPGADLAYMVVRGVVPDGGTLPSPLPTHSDTLKLPPQLVLDTLAEAKRTGWDAERFAALVARSGLAMAPGLAAQANFRGILSDNDYLLTIARGDLFPAYADPMREVSRQILTAGEYAELQLRGFYDERTRKLNTAKHGMTDADSDLLYNVLGRSVSVHQVTTGLARGGTYPSVYADVPQPYRAAIQRSNIREEWVGLAYANRYSYPSGFQIRGEAQRGALTYDETHQLLLEVGWSPRWATHFATSWTGGVAAKADPHVSKAQTQLWTTLHRSYLAGESSEAEVTAALPRAGVSAAAIPDVLATWDEERTIIRKQLSPAQVKKAYVEGVLNPDTGAAWTKDEATAALVARGYSTADATTFLEL